MRSPDVVACGGGTVSAHDNGGPAFPTPVRASDETPAGMTLRDYFAAKAMQAMVQGHFSHYGHEQYWPRDAIANEAYDMADHMLKERTK